MAAYYYLRMGFPIKGLRIDRYGDILSGYFVQKCIRHLGDAVRIGDPVCKHIRTRHNLFKNLYHELAGMVLIEDLVLYESPTALVNRTKRLAKRLLRRLTQTDKDPSGNNQRLFQRLDRAHTAAIRKRGPDPETLGSLRCVLRPVTPFVSTEAREP